MKSLATELDRDYIFLEFKKVIERPSTLDREVPFFYELKPQHWQL